MRIFLLGFMGSGKSYLGRQLAPKLGLDFIDLDQLIEERAEKSISDIFAEDGEMNFRLMESAALKSLGNQENLLIACGGGTPCFLDNMDWILENGRSVFLDTSVELLLERLKPELAQRPLLAGKSEAELQEYLQQKLEERMPFYQQAEWIYVQHKEQDAVAEISQWLMEN